MEVLYERWSCSVPSIGRGGKLPLVENREKEAGSFEGGGEGYGGMERGMGVIVTLSSVKGCGDISSNSLVVRFKVVLYVRRTKQGEICLKR
jgi:hypothetical protein